MNFVIKKIILEIVAVIVLSMTASAAFAQGQTNISEKNIVGSNTKMHDKKNHLVISFKEIRKSPPKLQVQSKYFATGGVVFCSWYVNPAESCFGQGTGQMLETFVETPTEDKWFQEAQNIAEGWIA